MEENLATAFQSMIKSGHLPDTHSEGHIYLIPKGQGSSDDIRNWRPITILNTIYKIFAKAWSLRIQPFLLKIIHSSQIGFIQ